MSSKSEIYTRIKSFIERGYKIKERNDKEDNGLASQGMLSLPYIDGSEFRTWLNEINTFSERHLKSHPLYKSIHDCYFFRNTKNNTFEEMIDLLQALANDDEYFELSSHEETFSENPKKEVLTLKKSKIFISHRSVDKEIADAIQDFLIALGVPRDMIFCSSLPGSDVKEQISAEVKNALKNSCLNIVILSRDYYKSAYCLNEAGVLWFLEIPVIPVAMPEIDDNKMVGFLGNEYKIRRLDSDIDLAFINDRLYDIGILESPKATVLNQETKKVIAKYNAYIKNRKVDDEVQKKPSGYNPNTDDEAAVLYYCASHKIRKVSKDDFIKWLYENEIYGINIDNAFDLISASGVGTVDKTTLTIDINEFRRLVSYKEKDLAEYYSIVDSHVYNSDISFSRFWDEDKFDDCNLLFISYIIDERMLSFSDRWMSEAQVKSIKQWESKNSLSSLLSSNYGACLSFFIENKWVYPSDYTSYGNPREYKLHNSVKRLLINDTATFISKLKIVKENYTEKLPF